MRLRELSREDVEKVRQWRNKCLYALRTSYMLTEEMQSKFYDDVVCNRNANARYWGIVDNYTLIGMCGLENIQWENGIAEISIIINPEQQHNGFGEKVIDLLLDQGFNHMRLKNIYGECYYVNSAIGFWLKIIKKYGGYQTCLPERKFYDNRFINSLYFNINKRGYTDYVADHT